MNLLPRAFLALACAAGLLSSPLEARPAGRPAWTPDSYLVYYGGWDEATVERALGYQLVILQPDAVTREQVQRLRAGRDRQAGTADDIKVLCYVSLGEDETPPRGLAPAPAAGPVHRVGTALVGANNDFPTCYLDEVKLLQGPDGFFQTTAGGQRRQVAGQDGLPDENGVWGSFYTAAGDPGWAERIRERTRTVWENLGPDGFFLDTLDTASRWGNYPWMEKDMVALVGQVRSWNPEAILVANRGLSLFYDDAEAMRASLDGVMYESFVTDWDWQRRRGVEHPFLADQVEVLRNLILAQATRPDGFFLLFLNYRDPAQPDFPSFLHRERELLQGVPHAAYWSTPDLQSIDPPMSQVFPPGGDVPAPPGGVRAERTATGVRLFVEPQPDAVLELVAGPTPTPLARRLTFTVPSRGGEVAVDLWGVREARLWARFLGRSAGQASEFVPAVVPGTPPAGIAGLSAESLDGQVRLRWTPAPGALYVVYAGPSPDALAKVVQARKGEAIVGGLVNDRAYAFAVAQVKNGKQVAFSEVVYGAPRDRTPPPPPANVTVSGSEVRWSPSQAPDLAGYRVYVWPEGKGLRLPLLAEKEALSVEVDHFVSGQRSRVFVTALDETGNESRPGPPAQLGP